MGLAFYLLHPLSVQNLDKTLTFFQTKFLVIALFFKNFFDIFDMLFLIFTLY